jgi:regulator of ribonuclease activity A
MPTHKRGEGEADVPAQGQVVWLRAGDGLVADEDGVLVLAVAVASI